MFVFQLAHAPAPARDDLSERIDTILSQLNRGDFRNAQAGINELRRFVSGLGRQLDRIPDLTKIENQSGTKVDTVRSALYNMQDKLQEMDLGGRGPTRGEGGKPTIPENKQKPPVDVGKLWDKEKILSRLGIPTIPLKPAETAKKEARIPKEGDADFIGPLPQTSGSPEEDAGHRLRAREAYMQEGREIRDERRSNTAYGEYLKKQKAAQEPSYDEQVAADAKEEERQKQRRGSVRFPEGEPEPVSFRTIIEGRKKVVPEKLKAPPPKRMDGRVLASLAMDSFAPGVEAGVKSFNNKAVTNERVQQELTSTIIYLNKLLVIDADAAKKRDAKTNLEMLRTAGFNEPQMRTAVELALLSAWIGATKTRDFLGKLGADGYRLDTKGKFMKDGKEATLEDLLKNGKYASHIPKSWLAKPLSAIGEFRKHAKPAPTIVPLQEALKPLSQIPLSKAQMLQEIFGIPRGATSQIAHELDALSKEQFALLSIICGKAADSHHPISPAEFQNTLKEIQGMDPEYVAIRLREEGYESGIKSRPPTEKPKTQMPITTIPTKLRTDTDYDEHIS